MKKWFQFLFVLNVMLFVTTVNSVFASGKSEGSQLRKFIVTSEGDFVAKDIPAELHDDFRRVLEKGEQEANAVAA